MEKEQKSFNLISLFSHEHFQKLKFVKEHSNKNISLTDCFWNRSCVYYIHRSD